MPRQGAPAIGPSQLAGAVAGLMPGKYRAAARHPMTYKDCCGLGEKLSASGPLVSAEALALHEECVDALRANSANGKLDEAALIEYLPKVRTSIRTDRTLAVSLENRIITILDEELSRLVGRPLPETIEERVQKLHESDAVRLETPNEADNERRDAG